MRPLVFVVLEVGAPAALGPAQKTPGSVDEGASLVAGWRGECQQSKHGMCVKPADCLNGLRVGSCDGVSNDGCPAAAMAFGPPLANESIVLIVPPLTLGLVMSN